ncbi:hypothetical protein CPT_Silence58 [Bacillus phage Silence]|nr:hypothetical protein CPT_Silence58 [Bacillus phage Silence]
MNPVLKKVDLMEFSLKQRKRICTCNTTCEIAVAVTTHKDGFIMCQNDARKMFYDMSNILLDDGKEGGFTDSEINYIKEYYSRNGMYRGFNRDVATALGRKYKSVKEKVCKMRASGVLK